nr:MAG TPA: capsid scaffolding protein [Caudoviricetes sp.]
MAEETTTVTAAAEQGATGTEQSAPNNAANTGNPAENAEPQGNAPDETSIAELVQRAVDRATNKLGNDNKKLRQQLEDLKKSKLTADEAAELERQEREDALDEREKALKDKENRMYAIKAIKEAGLDDGSAASLDLVEFVLADDEDGINTRVKTFGALVQRFVKAAVDKTFKANGRTPGVGNAASADDKDDTPSSLAVQLGKNAAKANESFKTTLDYYLGGNKR